MVFRCVGPFTVIIRDWDDGSYFLFDEGMARQVRAAGLRPIAGSQVGIRLASGFSHAVTCGFWALCSEELSVGETVRGRLSYDPTVRPVDPSRGLARLTVWSIKHGFASR